MRPAIHMISLLSILSLSLLSISGCGEKRIHVSTASGSPGEETGASASGTDTAGLAGTSVDESPLPGQGTSTDEVQAEAVQLPAPVQPPDPDGIEPVEQGKRLDFEIAGQQAALKLPISAHQAEDLVAATAQAFGQTQKMDLSAVISVHRTEHGDTHGLPFHTGDQPGAFQKEHAGKIKHPYVTKKNTRDRETY